MSLPSNLPSVVNGPLDGSKTPIFWNATPSDQNHHFFSKEFAIDNSNSKKELLIPSNRFQKHFCKQPKSFILKAMFFQIFTRLFFQLFRLSFVIFQFLLSGARLLKAILILNYCNNSFETLLLSSTIVF